MNICCISDCHLGYKHRFKETRLKDYENAFLEAVEKARTFEPALWIFAGDLLHHVKPDPESMKLVMRTLLKLAEKAHVVLCIGNHEIGGNLGTTYSPLFEIVHENIHVLSTENPHVVLNIEGKRIALHGFQYLRNKNNAEETLKEISNFEKNDIDFLCVHQALQGYLEPHEISVRCLKEVEKNYDLILFGHVHKHQRIVETDAPAYYVGSTERISFNEAENRTGFMVFRNLDFKNPEFVPVSSAPMKRISYTLGRKTPVEINEEINELIKQGIDKKLLQINLNVKVEGSHLDIRREWADTYKNFTVLDVNVLPIAHEKEITFDRIEINERLVEEYFGKMGIMDDELKRMCLDLYEKYA